MCKDCGLVAEKDEDRRSRGPDTWSSMGGGKAQMSPFGPTQMDPQRLVSGAQGTIGIVTWMSLKTRFLSEVSKAFLIPSNTLEPLIELSYKLTRIRFTGNIFILNGLNLAALMRQTPSEITALRDNLPPWVMFVSVRVTSSTKKKVGTWKLTWRNWQANGVKKETEVGGSSRAGSCLFRPDFT